MTDRDWDEKYGESDYLWTVEPNQFLVRELEDVEPGRALDLACGEGRNAVWLAEQGWKVTAVDFSQVGLAKAADLGRHRGVAVTWVAADLTDYQPPAESFDLVLVMYLHVPAAERRTILARATTALAPGGTLLVVGHDLRNLDEGHGGPPDPSLLYTPEQIASEAGGLAIVRSGHEFRTVATADGDRTAIDTLVRAVRDKRATGV